MNQTSRTFPIAVSTLVLAAMAVSAPAIACPLGRAIDLEQPVLPWVSTAHRDPLIAAKLATLPRKITLAVAVGDGAAVVRTLARTELRCGSGRGELIVRITGGVTTATVTGFDPITSECLRSSIAQVRFTRVTDGTLAKISIEI